jgi:NADH dehydrogenase
MRIAITGSNGFIGSALVQHFLSKGNEVILLQRKKPKKLPARATYIHFDLHDEFLLDNHISSLDVIIHTAFIPEKGGNNSSEKNISGTVELQRLAIKCNAQFIFLSSLSAHEEALSAYGKHKFELEDYIAPSYSLVLKLGLVTGNKGLYSRLKKVAQKSLFIPLIGGGNQPEQLVSIEQVIQAIDYCIEQKIKGVHFLANPEVQTLKEIFTQLAAQAGKKPIFIPISFSTVEKGIRLLEKLHIPSPVTKENLDGLKRMKAFDTRKDWEELLR